MTRTVDAPPARTQPDSPPPVAAPRPAPMLLVTGLSGAGRSTALKILEDLGYEAVDNLPLSMLGRITRGDGEPAAPIAIGIDSRTRGFVPDVLLQRLERLKDEARFDPRLVFLTCDDEVLRRRFTATRRRHPLAVDRPIADGIRQERVLLAPLRDHADLVIDSSELAIGELKQLIAGHFAPARRPSATIVVTSFAYRYGLPREADLVLDVRFLDNPHYRDDLRPLSGRDAAVGRFLEADAGFAPFFDGLVRLLGTLLPRFEREGKSYLTIAVGCTGGRHRSVFVAERLARWLGEDGREVALRHRDLARSGEGG